MLSNSQGGIILINIVIVDDDTAFLHKSSDEYFCFVEKTLGTQRSIKFSNIAYFLSFDQEICFLDVRANKMFSIKSADNNGDFSLDYLEKYLSTNCFVRSHRSYLVNCRHIFEIKGERIIFTNGSASLISDVYADSFRMRYHSELMRDYY